MKAAREGNRRIKDNNTTMNMKMIVSKLKDTIIRKRTLYMLCFFLLMIIDWTRGSQVGSTWAWTVNMTGVIMAVIMFSSYNIREFNKPVYIVYSLAGIVALPLSYLWWNAHQEIVYRDKLLTAVLNVWLLGVLLIKLIDDVVIQKRKKPHFTKLEIILAGMLLWMFISVNEDVWPIWYLIMFELFYHTDYSAEDMEAMKQGLLDGIILAFFVLQGAAFVFRPFDDPHYRYCGIYANCNMNALFYCIVCIALLLKLFYLRKNNEKIGKRVLYFCLASGVMGFIIMTISKTAWLSIIITGFIYIIFADLVLLKRKARKVTCSIVIMIFVTCLSIPIVYGMVRYIPTVFHHPVWYDGEYSEDRVHSFDSPNSEKYVSYEEMMDEIYNRILPYVEIIMKPMSVNAAERNGQGETIINGNTYDSRYDSAIGRVYMWKYYFTHGNVVGHLSTEGHDIGLPTYVWHAQNVFIQFWYYYGIPASILLVIYIAISILKGIVQCVKEESSGGLFAVSYIVLFASFGLFEAVWYPGQMIMLLVFLTFKFLQKE